MSRRQLEVIPASSCGQARLVTKQRDNAPALAVRRAGPPTPTSAALRNDCGKVEFTDRVQTCRIHRVLGAEPPRSHDL